MTDRELLEYAAKAAGYRLEWFIPMAGSDEPHIEGIDWNPLTDDGDALRLAVKLGISIDHDYIEVGVLTAGGMANGEYEMGVEAWKVSVNTNIKCEELHGDDPLAATRRAITRAAAEIGKNL